MKNSSLIMSWINLAYCELYIHGIFPYIFLCLAASAESYCGEVLYAHGLHLFSLQCCVPLYEHVCCGLNVCVPQSSRVEAPNCRGGLLGVIGLNEDMGMEPPLWNRQLYKELIGSDLSSYQP